MLSDLMGSFFKVTVTALVATALIFTGLHQFIWRNQPYTYSPIRMATYEVRGAYGACSGVLIAPKQMLTAAHCLQMGDLFVKGVKAVVVKFNPVTDVALLFVEVDCPCVPVGDTPALDTNLVAVGYPLGIGVQYLSKGTSQGDVPEYSHYMAMTVPLMFGNSGGGVFQFQNGKWKVVGVASAMAGSAFGPAENITMAVNVKSIKELLK